MKYVAEWFFRSESNEHVIKQAERLQGTLYHADTNKKIVFVDAGSKEELIKSVAAELSKTCPFTVRPANVTYRYMGRATDQFVFYADDAQCAPNEAFPAIPVTGPAIVLPRRKALYHLDAPVAVVTAREQIAADAAKQKREKILLAERPAPAPAPTPAPAPVTPKNSSGKRPRALDESTPAPRRSARIRNKKVKKH